MLELQKHRSHQVCSEPKQEVYSKHSQIYNDKSNNRKREKLNEPDTCCVDLKGTICYVNTQCLKQLLQSKVKTKQRLVSPRQPLLP